MERDSGRESGRESAGSSSVDEDTRSEPLRKDTPGPMPQFQYSREKLQEIQETEESKIRPKCLSPLYDNSEGIWDPEKWCKSLNPEGVREGSPITLGEIRERKRPLDHDRDIVRRKLSVDRVKEVKEEQDGIVLSPQRRSFGTGCHVTSGLARQSSTTSDYSDDRDRGERRERRIGSGRIQIDRDQVRDYRGGRYERDDRIEERHDERSDRRFDRNDRFRRDYDDRRDFRDSRDIRDRDSRGERMDRGDSRGERIERGDPRDRLDRGDPRDRDTRNIRSRDPREYNSRDRDNHRYSSSRRNQHQEEEPEWFTSGPTSKSDTIELQGFDKDESRDNDPEVKIEEPKPKRERKSQVVEKHGRRSLYVDKRDRKSPCEGNIGQKNVELEKGTNFGDRNGSLETNESSSPEAAETRPSPTTAALFDFDQFFHGSSSIPGLRDEIPNPENESGSRFSQWFSQAKGSKNNSRRSSINDEFPFEYLNDMLKESKSPLMPSPTPPPTSLANVFDKAMFGNFGNLEQDKLPSLETVLHHKNMAVLNPSINHQFMANNPNHDKSNASISNQGMSPQDAEAHIKAMLFGGRKDSGSSSGTASPGAGSRLKTVAELEAGFHQNSPGSSARMSPVVQHQQLHANINQKTEEGDLTAFNKLLNLMAAGAAGSGSPSPPNTHQLISSEVRQMSPLTNTNNLPHIMNNMHPSQNSKFIEAVMRNREEQIHLQQQAIQQMRINQQAPPPQPSPLPLPQHMLTTQQQHHQLQQQQQMQSGPRPINQDRILTNFIQQNPTIVTKPPSPAINQIPNIVHSTSTPRIGPSPTPMMANNLLQKQHAQPATPRIPSPIMFSQQPPMHLNAPSPIHPSQLGRTMPNNNLSTSPTMINRVPSPQELIAHNQAILQSALIKKQLEDQKERFLKKQQDRSKSPGFGIRPVVGTTVTTSSYMNNIIQQQQPQPQQLFSTSGTTNNKTTMSPAFTPTSVMRKMHSDKASEKEKGRPDSDENLNKAPIKQLVPDNPTDTESGKIDQVPNGQMDFVISQEMNKMQFGNNAVPATNNNKSILRSVVGNTQNQTPSTPQPTGPGRPIFKSSCFTSTPQQHSQAMTQMSTSTPQLHQSRTVMGGSTPNSTPPSGHRPITGGMGNPNVDINKILQQIRPPTQSAPIPRPGLSSNPQFGIPITGRMPPIQSNLLPGQVHPAAAANALLMQQMIQSNNNVRAVNMMNQLNPLNHQINQLNLQAALQAQHRMMDPRLQTMRGVYHSPVPPMLSPRSNATTNVSMVSPTNTHIGRAPSPANFISQKQKNGPMSPNRGNILQQNSASDGNIFNKLFGNTVLKSQLPSMPPLPVQGQRVMTVDEIERS